MAEKISDTEKTETILQALKDRCEGWLVSHQASKIRKRCSEYKCSGRGGLQENKTRKQTKP